MKNLKTIILAAGKSVRMKSSTPKVLYCLCGKPIIRYITDLVKSTGIRDTYIVLGHQSEVIRKYLKYLGKDISIVKQKRLLGTADAIKQTAPYLRKYKGDILVLCADTPLLRKETVRKLIKAHRKFNAVCTILTSVIDNPKGYGRVIRGINNDVLAIREEKDAIPGEKRLKEINTGVYCFKSSALFNAIKSVRINKKKKEFYLTDIVELLVKSSAKVKAVKTDDPNEGLGINTRNDLAKAERIARYRILKDLMFKGVNITDPESTYINDNVRIGKDTVIRPFTVIDDDVIIGQKCIIGPFCHIRPGTKIGNDVSIGNFTEVSRTSMGDKCFMQHFSFLGDSIVGRRVNIGAGVITANYDGKNKNKTYISDDSFIGSDSILIAPLKIGKKVIIGAGSVVTKKQRIPAGSVVLGVPAKIISRRKAI